MKKFLFPVLMMVCVTYAYADKAVYAAKYADGIMPIVVDGVLDDWAGVGAKQVGITNFVPANKTIPTPSAGDLSGWFMCAADNQNVYIAVHVTDDVLMTDINGFTRSSWDDIVEICYDGDLKNIEKPNFDANDGQLMIVGGKDGLRWISGRVPYLKTLIPHYWDDAVGVNAGYKQFSGGYTVEVKIPLSALGRDRVSNGTRIGLNVRILESDDTAKAGTNVNEGALSWADDPKLTSSWSTATYNQVVFMTKVGGAAEGITVVSTGKKGLLVDVGASGSDVDTNNAAIINAVNEKLVAHDLAGAVAACESVKDQQWAKCLVAAISAFRQDYEISVGLLDEGAKNTDVAVSDWAKNFPREYSYYMLRSKRYDDLNPKYPQKPSIEVADFMNKWMRQEPTGAQDNETHILGLLDMGASNNDPQSLNALEKLSRDAATTEIADKTKLMLAKRYFLKGDYSQARKVADEVISSSKNEKAVSNAKRINLSIDMSE